jgi:hypothetical protein
LFLTGGNETNGVPKENSRRRISALQRFVGEAYSHPGRIGTGADGCSCDGFRMTVVVKKNRSAATAPFIVGGCFGSAAIVSSVSALALNRRS